MPNTPPPPAGVDLARSNIRNSSQIGNTISIGVEDSENGISPDALPKIFDPFFTTKIVRSRHGSSECPAESSRITGGRSTPKTGTAVAGVVHVFAPRGGGQPSPLQTANRNVAESSTGTPACDHHYIPPLSTGTPACVHTIPPARAPQLRHLLQRVSRSLPISAHPNATITALRILPDVADHP